MKILSLFLIALIVVADGRTLHRVARQTSNPQNIARCINSCLRTPEYNPLCGTNRETYNNIGHLTCAQFCGVDVKVLFNGACVPFA